ncbi:MAG: ComF family protein [Rickettsiaceae bacterium]|nr:ComF family protein [Rickettsiaceae bacterium]
MLRAVLSNVIDYILPYRCASCSELTDGQNGVCSECFQKLNFITLPYCNICGFPFEFVVEGQFSCAKCIALPPKYNMSRSLFKFDQKSKSLVHAFKYSDQTNNAKMFAKLLLARYQLEIQNIDLVIPVPMHRWKRVFRNYNPAQILALELGKLVAKPMIPDVLIKQKWTISQIGLSKSKRSKNLEGSIKLGNKHSVKGKAILLVDDVKTTGATSNLCSQILKKAGATSVTLVTISLT